ncbi:hypothetical protein BGW80DRAFT_1556688 [Lactifluus volemus]|nr:hypothetical protein BGW80DRAFT_1556688 [Lactifluus volemus]
MYGQRTIPGPSAKGMSSLVDSHRAWATPSKSLKDLLDPESRQAIPYGGCPNMYFKNLDKRQVYKTTELSRAKSLALAHPFVRSQAAIAILCFASQVTSSCAAPLKAKRAPFNPTGTTQTIASTSIQYAVNMLFQAALTKIASAWKWKGSMQNAAAQTTSSRREVLEYIQTRANEELAFRMYKRESSTLLERTWIDDLD